MRRWLVLVMLLAAAGGCATKACFDSLPHYEVVLRLPPEGVPAGLKLVLTHPDYGTHTFTEADFVTYNDPSETTTPVCVRNTDGALADQIRCDVAGFPPGNAFVASAPGYRTVALFPYWRSWENSCGMQVFANEATLVAE